MGDALTFVHQQNFLHRDVKPLNILLRRTSLDAVLIDFGLARKYVQGMVMSHTDSKTEGYAPIEQYERRAQRGTFTDVYALAATYYVMRTGKVPFPANFRKDANIPLTAPKQYNSQISESENQAILKGMELLPKDRPQTVVKWLELLKGETDEKTKRVMLKGAGREKEGWLKADQLLGSWVIWVGLLCFFLFCLWYGGVTLVERFGALWALWNEGFSWWFLFLNWSGWVMAVFFYFSLGALLGCVCVLGLQNLLKGKDLW